MRRAHHLLRRVASELGEAAAVVDAHALHMHVGLLVGNSVPQQLCVLLLGRIVLSPALRRLMRRSRGRLHAMEARVHPWGSSSVLLQCTAQPTIFICHRADAAAAVGFVRVLRVIWLHWCGGGGGIWG